MITKEDIINEAIEAAFATIQAHLDPKAELDLGGWAGIVYDETTTMHDLRRILSSVYDGHVEAVKEADETL